MAETYTVRFPDGRTVGPADLAHLQELARAGHLSSDAVVMRGDGSEELGIMTVEALRPYLEAPPTAPTGLPEPPPDETLSALIPLSNPPALIGYYLAVASLIPGVGLLCGPVAIALGTAGYRKSQRQRQHQPASQRRRRSAAARGAVHAWIAILVGSLATFINYGLVLRIFVFA